MSVENYWAGAMLLEGRLKFAVVNKADTNLMFGCIFDKKSLQVGCFIDEELAGYGVNKEYNKSGIVCIYEQRGGGIFESNFAYDTSWKFSFQQY